MSALLRAELLKLRTTRTFAALVGSALALSLLLVVLTTVLDDNFSEEDVRVAFTGDFTGLFIVLLGVMGMAGEWRHRTITSTVLAAPDRLKLLAAKTLAYALVGAVVSLVVTALIMAVGSTILSSRDELTLGLSDLADVLWRNVVVSATAGAFGVCVGALVRNQVVAIIGLLFLTMAIEPALLGLVPDVGRFGPTSGAPGGITETSFDDDLELLPAGAAVAVMLGWIAVLFASAAAVLRRRDLT